MKKRIKYSLIFTIIVIILALFAIRFVSGEDDWICSGGQWTKHGNPSGPMPTSKCK